MKVYVGMGANKKASKKKDNKEINELKAKIAELEKENTELNTKVAELEKVSEK